MKIFERIKTGKLKGWTIRVSKYGWYDLYSSGGISQRIGKHTLEAIRKVIKDLENNNTTTKLMSNKKQTAVEWQFDELQKAEKDWRNEAIDGKEYNDKKYQILKQAKEMEKQQIIDAYWDGGQDIPLTENRCESYYKETYNNI